MKRLLLLILIFLVSCSTSQKDDDSFKRRNLSEYFMGSGVVQYFLPDLPKWANVSQTASCHREVSPRFLDFKKMNESFSLSYEQLLQFQYSYNMKAEKFKRRFQSAALLLKDEERLFYETSDQIQGDIVPFRKPKFKRVHLIWVDDALANEESLKGLRDFMKTQVATLGHPVFLSLCLSHSELEKFLIQNKLDPQSSRLIPFEMFSPYGNDFKLNTYFSLNIGDLFGDKYELHFYAPRKVKLLEFKGDYTLHRY